MSLFLVVSVALAAVVVLMIAAVALLGWGGVLSQAQRLGLAGIAAGIAWAGPGRALGRGPGLGDLLMLLGLVVYLAATYGPALFHKADSLDGVTDGRIGPSNGR